MCALCTNAPCTLPALHPPSLHLPSPFPTGARGGRAAHDALRLGRLQDRFDRIGAHRSTVKVPLFAVPQLGSCASSGHAWRLRAARHSQEEAGPLGAQPLPLLLERAASKAAHFPAFDHAGIAVDHVAHILPSGDSNSGSALTQHLGTQHTAITMLTERIEIVRSYLQLVADGTVPADHEILREIKCCS